MIARVLSIPNKNNIVDLASNFFLEVSTEVSLYSPHHQLGNEYSALILRKSRILS